MECAERDKKGLNKCFITLELHFEKTKEWPRKMKPRCDMSPILAWRRYAYFKLSEQDSIGVRQCMNLASLVDFGH